MKIEILACIVLALGLPAGAAEPKSSGKSKVQSHSEMDCDHSEAEKETASARKGAGALIVRGEKIDGAPTLSLLELLRSAERHDGKMVVVEGKVRRACSRMGCWMELAVAEKGPGVRVTFKDYGFFVPTDSAGAKAKVQGTVRVVELSDGLAAHYQSEGGNVAKDTQGKHREVQLVASGVELKR
jgi:hypothetical protein